MFQHKQNRKDGGSMDKFYSHEEQKIGENLVVARKERIIIYIKGRKQNR